MYKPLVELFAAGFQKSGTKTNEIRASPPMNPRDFLSRLPPELGIEIVKHLEVVEARRLRLVSRSFARLGMEAMIRDGALAIGPRIESDRGDKTDPIHLRDMLRLEWMAHEPVLAKQIRRIVFYAGDTSARTVQKTLEDEPEELMPPTTALLELFQSFLRELPGNYDIEQRHHRYFYADSLARDFALLPNVERLTVTSTQCPFYRNSRTKQAWNYLRYFYMDFEEVQDARIAEARYLNVLAAAAELPRPLSELTLDCMPLACLKRINKRRYNRRQHPGPHPVVRMLSRVQYLHVGLDGGHHEGGWLDTEWLPASITNFFGSMSELRGLDISFRMSIPEEVNYGGALLKSFYENTFPKLEALELGGMFLSDYSADLDFLPFLLRHAKSLRRLKMDILWIDNVAGELFLSEDLGTLRKEMELESFKLIDTSDNLTDEHILEGRLLECYVLGKCSYPMADGYKYFHRDDDEVAIGRLPNKALREAFKGPLPQFLEHVLRLEEEKEEGEEVEVEVEASSSEEEEEEEAE